MLPAHLSFGFWATISSRQHSTSTWMHLSTSGPAGPQLNLPLINWLNDLVFQILLAVLDVPTVVQDFCKMQKIW